MNSGLWCVSPFQLVPTKKIVKQEARPSLSAQRFKVAVVQASPVVFDRERTLEKVHVLSGDAPHRGAKLVLFPESVCLCLSARTRLRGGDRFAFRGGP